MKLGEIKRKLNINMVPWQPVAKQQDKPNNILLAIKKALLSCSAFTGIHLLHYYPETQHACSDHIVPLQNWIYEAFQWESPYNYWLPSRGWLQ